MPAKHAQARPVILKNVCGREGTCEKDGGNQMCVVGRVHVKRTGGSNACGGEGTCEKDGGGGSNVCGGEGTCEKDGGIKCVWWGGYM